MGMLLAMMRKEQIEEGQKRAEKLVKPAQEAKPAEEPAQAVETPKTPVKRATNKTGRKPAKRGPSK